MSMDRQRRLQDALDRLNEVSTYWYFVSVVMGLLHVQHYGVNFLKEKLSL